MNRIELNRIFLFPELQGPERTLNQLQLIHIIRNSNNNTNSHL